MKSKYIRSSSPSQRQRNVGDQPAIGPVARIPGAGKRLQTGERRRRKRGSGSSSRINDRRRLRQLQARKFAIRLWASIILVGCLATLGTVGFLWLRAQEDRKRIAPRFAVQQALPALQLTDFTPPSEREAIAIIQHALNARDAETLREFVHDSHEVTPEQMLAFFAATGERDGAFNRHQWIGSSNTETLQIQSMVLAFEKDGRITQRLAMLVPSEAGEWRLDFPSFARWCDPPIQLMEQPDGYPGGRVRVFLTPDLYFNGPFSDDREWACFSFTSPDIEKGGFAYCRIGSPEHISLQAAFAMSGRAIRANLEIARVPEAQSRQFLIKNIVSKDWIAIHPEANTD